MRAFFFTVESEPCDGVGLITGMHQLMLIAAITTLTIPMRALNGSSENGVATVTQVSDGVSVSIRLDNGSSIAQPTHIHLGTCAAIVRAPEYALTNTVDGKSDTVVRGIKLGDLLAGNYAINVHKSASELGTYSSCGNIK